MAALASAAVATTSAAAIALPEGDEFAAEVDDLGFIVGLTDMSMTIEDGATTVSESSAQAAADAVADTPLPCLVRMSTQSPTGEPLLNTGGWEEGECPVEEGGPSPAEIAAAATTAFRSLPLVAPPITYQPNGDWALVNIDFIVYTDPAAQSLDTELFGIPITIRATPVHYRWDFGDGTTLSTTDPGRPYPDQTVAHVYTSAADAVSVTMATSWRGEFMVGGSGTWIPIAGFATTTSTTNPVEIVAMDVHLVPNS